jgi:hypothetical protein
LASNTKKGEGKAKSSLGFFFELIVIVVISVGSSTAGGGRGGWTMGLEGLKIESASRPPCGFWRINDQQLEI